MALPFASHLALLLTTLFGPTPAPTMQAYHFAHDGVLGTSLDLTFTAATPEAAAQAERAALAEIERLRLVLSSYDASSEVSRLLVSGGSARPSADLTAVLDRYSFWNQQSGGAYSARVAPLSALWRAAEAAGDAAHHHRHPDDAGESQGARVSLHPRIDEHAERSTHADQDAVEQAEHAFFDHEPFFIATFQIAHRHASQRHRQRLTARVA